MTSATDNRTTELINGRVSRLLHEAGVDFTVSSLMMTGSMEPYDKFTVFDADKMPIAQIETSFHNNETVLLTLRCTPEQAIAATLGGELNPDGLPVGLTISDDGNLLNWRGENYVRQAIAATLGRGECELLYGEDDDGVDSWWCQSCGARFDATFEDGRMMHPKFCQLCRRKAVKQ